MTVAARPQTITSAQTARARILRIRAPGNVLDEISECRGLGEFIRQHEGVAEVLFHGHRQFDPAQRILASDIVRTEPFDDFCERGLRPQLLRRRTYYARDRECERERDIAKFRWKMRADSSRVQLDISLYYCHGRHQCRA